MQDPSLLNSTFMVLILDGNTELVAHLRSNLFSFDLLMAIDYIQREYIYIFSFLRTQHVLGYHLI